MAFRYRINLIRERASRERHDRTLARIFTVSLLLLAVMLMITYRVYMTRQFDLDETARSTEILIESSAAAKVNAEEVARLLADSEKRQKELATLGNIVADSVSWAQVLVTLADCRGSDDIRFETLNTVTHDGTPFIVLRGLCVAEDPVGEVNALIQRIAGNEAFGAGRLLSLQRNEEERVVFEVEVPLTRQPFSSIRTTGEE